MNLKDVRLLHLKAPDSLEDEGLTFAVLDPENRLPAALRMWADVNKRGQNIIEWLRGAGFQIDEPVNIYEDDPGTWEVLGA